MVKSKEQSKELFFVHVKDPDGIRRNILETLKEILEILQRFEKFKRIRHEKLENVHKLRALIKDTNKMLGDLKAKMPQTSLRPVVVREEHHKKAHHKKKKGKEAKEIVRKKEPTELERLESELNAIESKLKSLS